MTLSEKNTLVAAARRARDAATRTKAAQITAEAAAATTYATRESEAAAVFADGSATDAAKDAATTAKLDAGADLDSARLLLKVAVQDLEPKEQQLAAAEALAVE